jgi:hypothetical protein
MMLADLGLILFFRLSGGYNPVTLTPSARPAG